MRITERQGGAESRKAGPTLPSSHLYERTSVPEVSIATVIMQELRKERTGNVGEPRLPANDLVPDRDQARLLPQVTPQLAHLVFAECVLVRVELHVVLCEEELAQVEEPLVDVARGDELVDEGVGEDLALAVDVRRDAL